MRIAHFGDIHIKPFDRHNEYREGFESFFNKAKELKLDHIVLAGDIVDEKTQRITPEVIDMLVWLFNGMANVAPTHIILGNHDGNLKNLDRKDAISPIINAIQNTNINLYFKSGNYYVDNINFCAFSPFDEKGWTDIKVDKEKINICIFHGSVQDALTDLNHKLHGEVDVSFFNKFDYSMLGDIHRQQFLNKRKTIAYCGSTFQQNFGESINGHGYLIWDIKDKETFSVVHHEIENKKPFVNLRWENDISTFMEKANKYPIGSRFRIKSLEKIPQYNKTLIENELKNNREASLILFKHDINKSVKTSHNSESLRRDLRNYKVLYKLYKDYIGLEISGDDEKNIKNILKNYLLDLNNGDEVDRGGVWNIKRLEFSNLMRFGENNIIDFDKLEGLIGIFAPNMSGKSTIIAAITYALFGRIDRDILQNHYHKMINNAKEQCSATLYFEIKGRFYKIKRISKRVEKKGGRYGVKTDVYFYEVDCELNTIQELHAEKPQETEKVIRKLIGTLEDFKLTAFANQRNVESFMKEKVTSRKQHLTRFRDLESLEFIHAKAKEDWSEKKAILKSLQMLDWDVEIAKLHKEIDNNNIEIDKLAHESNEYNKKLLKIKNEISYRDKIITEEDVKKQKNKVISIKNEREILEEKINKIIAYKKKIKERLEKIEYKKSLIDVDVIKRKIEKRSEIDVKIAKFKFELKNANSTLEKKEKVIKKLDIVPCGDKYPTCIYIKDAHSEKKNIEPQKDFIKNLEEQIKKLEILLVDEEDLKKKLELFSLMEKKEISLLKEDASLSEDYYKKDLKRLEKNLLEEENKLKELEINVQDVSDSYKSLKEQERELKSIIQFKDKKRIEIATNLGSCKNKIEKFENDKKTYLNTKNVCDLYQNITTAFGKKGIPNQILKMDLPAINNEIKEILSEIDGVNSVEFFLEEESEKLDILVEGNNMEVIPIELCSGAQLVIASVALRVGLMRASNLPKPNVLILDEPFEGLDIKRIDNIISMFESLKKWFKKIIIISHMDIIKDTADDFIEIVATEKKSSVNYI